MIIKKIFTHISFTGIISIFILIAGCSSEETKNVKSDSPFMDSAISQKAKTDSPVQKPDTIAKVPAVPSIPAINGIVHYNLPYCGGARPTEEIIADREKLRLLTASKLKLKNASGEFFITTDSKGEFSSGIPAGAYEVFLTKEINPTIYDVSPNACEDCLTKAITSVKIVAGKKAEITFKFRCEPMAYKRQ